MTLLYDVPEVIVVPEKQTFSVYWHNLTKNLCQIDVETETHKGAIAFVESELIMTQEDFKKPLLVLIKGAA